jgi:hypothetical protein
VHIPARGPAKGYGQVNARLGFIHGEGPRYRHSGVNNLADCKAQWDRFMAPRRRFLDFLRRFWHPFWVEVSLLAHNRSLFKCLARTLHANIGTVFLDNLPKILYMTATNKSSLTWPLASLLSGVSMLVVGIALLSVAIGAQAGFAKYSALVTGMIMSAYFAGFVYGSFACPALIRRVGYIRAFAVMASVASALPVLHAVWTNPWFWGLLRFVTGLCIVGLYMVIESWLNVVADRESRGKVFAAYMAVSGVSMALGQWLILVGELWFCAFCAGVGAVFVCAHSHHDDHHPRTATDRGAVDEPAGTFCYIAHRLHCRIGFGPDQRHVLQPGQCVWRRRRL